MLNNTASMYSRDELYTYNEACGVIGVSYQSLMEAIRYDTLTSVRLPGHLEKFVLKSEVDLLKGKRRINSRGARAVIELARQRSKNALQSQSDKEFNLDGTPDYISGSELRVILKEQGIQFERILNVKLQEQRDQFLQEVKDMTARLLDAVIQMSRQPGGSEMLNGMVDELRASNQQRMTNPNMQRTPLEQSLVDALVDPEEQAELEAMRREIFGGAE